MAIDNLSPEILAALKAGLAELNEEGAKFREAMNASLGADALSDAVKTVEQLAAVYVDIVENNRNLKELQDEITKSLEAQHGKKWDTLTAAERQLLISQEELDILSKISEQIAKQAQSAENRMSSLEDIRHELTHMVDSAKEEEEIRKRLKKLYGDQLKDGADLNKFIDEKLKSEGELTKELKKQLTTQQAQQAAAEAIKDANEKQVAANEHLNSIAAKLLRNLTGIRGEAETTLGKIYAASDGMKDFGKNIGKVGVKMAVEFTSVSKNLDSLAASATQIFALVSRQLVSMVTSFDQSMVDLKRATGEFGADFEAQVFSAAEAGREMGVTTTEATESLSGLIDNSKTFIGLAGDQRQEVLKLATQFKKMGVSGENFSQTLDTVNKSFGGTIGDTQELTLELGALARVTGQKVNKVIGDFQQSLSYLAAYSLPQARQEFVALQSVAVGVGVEMNQLIGLASQFDTFESAANKVGELNAMLGGPYLNTLDMINATESQRIDLLRNAVKQTDQSFESMDRFQKKAIAAALGIQDLEVAQRIFDGTAMSIEEATAQLDAQNKSFFEMGEEAAKNVSITEQFKQIWDEVLRALGGPEGLKGIITSFGEFLQMISNGIQTLQEWGLAGPILMAALVVGFAAPFLAVLSSIVGLIGGPLHKTLEKLSASMEKVADSAQLAGKAATEAMDDTTESIEKAEHAAAGGSLTTAFDKVAKHAITAGKKSTKAIGGITTQANRSSRGVKTSYRNAFGDVVQSSARARQGAGNQLNALNRQITTTHTRMNSLATKGGGKGFFKGGLKGLMKKLPVAGLVMGGVGALTAAAQGDWKGAASEVASGALSTLGPAGMAASMAMDMGMEVMQEGGIAKGGPTLVADGGPELVMDPTMTDMKPGTQVLSSQRTVAALNNSAANSRTMTERMHSVIRQTTTTNTTLIERNNQIMSTIAEKIGEISAKEQKIIVNPNIKLAINERDFAHSVEEVMMPTNPATIGV